MNIHALNIDPVQKTVQMTFNEQNTSAIGTVSFKLEIEKQETMEEVERIAKHKVAEMLEAAAKALRQHHG